MASLTANKHRLATVLAAATSDITPAPNGDSVGRAVLGSGLAVLWAEAGAMSTTGVSSLLGSGGAVDV